MSIPENYIHKYATSFWNSASIPASVLGMHANKSGVYGRLSVMKGTIKYQQFSAEDVQVPERETLIEAGAFMTTSPEQWQRIEPLTEETYFMIDFFAAPDVKLEGFGLKKVLNV